MGKGILYRDGDGLELMESFQDGEFKLIYLDPPYDTNKIEDSFVYEGEGTIRRFLSKTRKCNIEDITREDIAEEKQRRIELRQKAYREYITQLLENAQRLLTDDGILCFLAPSTRYTDINFQFMLDQMFGNSMNVTIERRVVPNHNHGVVSNNDTLYFYSKNKNFEFVNLKELANIEEFPYRDDYDYYKLMSCEAMNNFQREALVYEWKGIMPKKAWRYSKKKMQELDEQNRIEVKNDRLYLKVYRTEHPVTVSSVWKNTGYPCYIISEENMRRMFSLFVREGDKVLAPFERDGVFAYIADEFGLNWHVLHQSNLPERIDRIYSIDSSHYEEKIIESDSYVEYKAKVIANATEAKELQEHLEQLTNTIEGLQKTLDIDASEDVVEAVIEKMHEKIIEAVSYYSLDSCYPEAEEWLLPYWENLEEESKLFIPTGIFLYKQLQGNKKADVAAIMLEYCKSLEREMFHKMFKEYVAKLVKEGTNVRATYADSFRKDATRTFAEFLEKCTDDKYKNDESQWKFEMGKMRFVLQMVLSKKKDKDPLVQNFRDYLETIFDSKFFRDDFNDKLSVITKLRNDCAHGEVITTNVDDSREMIREKLLMILKHKN